METSGLKYQFQQFLDQEDVDEFKMMKFFQNAESQNRQNKASYGYIETQRILESNGVTDHPDEIIDNEVINIDSSNSENNICLEITPEEFDRSEPPSPLILDGTPKPLRVVKNLFNIKTSYNKKKNGVFKAKDNILVLHPLDIYAKKAPARVTFESVENLMYAEKVKVFLSNEFDDMQPLKVSKNCPLLKSCSCSHHCGSLFCAKVDDYAVQWTMEGNPTATVEITKQSKLEIQIGALMSSLDYRKQTRHLTRILTSIVFQIERLDEIVEERYYLKVSSSPSRDLEKFVKEVKEIKDGNVMAALHDYEDVVVNNKLQIKRQIDDDDEFDEFNEKNLYCATLSLEQESCFSEFLRNANCEIIYLKKSQSFFPK